MFPDIRNNGVFGLYGILNSNQPTGININDTRDVDMASGVKMTDKNRMSNSAANTKTIKDIVNAAVKHGVDPYTALAIAHQETKLEGNGDTEGNPFHLVDNRADDLIDDGMKLFNEKMKIADSRGKKTEAERIQAFNGYGKVGRHTEGGQKKLYGINVSKEPIDMDKNPVYGKRILDLRENVIKKNPDIVRMVQQMLPTKNPMMGMNRIVR